MIDLHIHTDNSDGVFSTVDILKLAEKNNLKLISITDHNTIEAHNILKKIDISQYFSGKIITGVEISCKFKDYSLEVLGYNFDVDLFNQNELMQEHFKEPTIKFQIKRLEYLKSVCQKLNIKYDKNISMKRPYFYAHDVIADDIVKYPENKEILEKMNIIDNTSNVRANFARKHCFNKNSTFYSDYLLQFLSVFEAVEIIKSCGGISFLAHPFGYGIDNAENLVDEILNLNIVEGIECVQRKHNNEQTQYLIDICDKNHLLKSGGGDFHNESHYFGHGNNGKYKIEFDLIKEWVDFNPNN